MSIAKIVITGGPCSGKTTGMNYLREKLSNLGYKVFIIPESATEIISSGFNPKTATRQEFLRFEEKIILSQIFHENMLLEFAEEVSSKGKKCVVLFDRGTMDARAYLENHEFNSILHKLSKTIIELRDKRYDAVIHMITAANGAAQYYTLVNNAARQEVNLDEAISSCDRTVKAWVGHPHLRVVDNSTDFEGKIRRVYQEICQVLGIPVPLEKERKFLISDFKLPSDLPVQVVDIEQVYLKSTKPDVEERVRRRGQDDSFVFYRTSKIPTDKSDTRQEQEWQISEDEYNFAVKYDADPLRLPVVKQRHVFLWNNVYYELDIIKSPNNSKGLTLLEVELTGDNNHLEIPDFIQIVKEVTGDKNFSNFYIALNQK